MRRLFLLSMLISSACVCEAKPKMSDFIPKWKDGLSWKVSYEYSQPSPAAVMDPADEQVRQVWDYAVARAPEGGWLLTVKEEASPLQERYEVSFTTDLAVARVQLFNHLGEAHQVFNDMDGPAFLAETTAPPLLDWPPWASGRLAGESCVLSLDRPGYSAFTEKFVWKKGQPWWSRAERVYGARRIKARLLEP